MYSEPSDNANQVIHTRYSLKDENGKPTEDWPDIVVRVVGHVAKAEINPVDRDTFIHNMVDLMMERKFLPNTPCLVNAGKPNGQLAGCFVLPIDDSIKGIMKAATDAAVIHQSGGGTGFTFETLRPAGSLVNTTHGIASGPVSFMRIFDTTTDVIKQGGVRRGANMGIMRCDHPDILEFIHAKNDQHSFLNFNISVAITDEFMEAVKNGDWIQTKFNGEPWTKPIIDPLGCTGLVCDDKGRLNTRYVWARIVESAHKFAEPGVIFIDTVNKKNLLKSLGPITATNPCAEQALHNYNSCNLGSIDVAKFFKPDWNGANSYTGEDTPEGNFDWDSFGEAIYWSVRFLDNVVDTCSWPLPEIEDIVKRTRPVGLGIMGFADLCLKLKLRYGSPECISFLKNLISAFRSDAWEASLRLGREKGAFPEYTNNKESYDQFFWNELGFDDLLLNQLELVEPGNAGHFMPRNYEVTTIAPTGTISLVADTSSGIEPNFSWFYTRRDTVGERTYIHPMVAETLGITKQDPHTGTILTTAKLPEHFVTAHELTAQEHVEVLAAAQQFIDNGVSKTCNGNTSDTVEDVDRLYRQAYALGVKSVSYYRDGSRTGQVITHKNLCPECGEELVETKCKTCPKCGWSLCNV